MLLPHFPRQSVTHEAFVLFWYRAYFVLLETCVSDILVWTTGYSIRYAPIVWSYKMEEVLLHFNCGIKHFCFSAIRGACGIKGENFKNPRPMLCDTIRRQRFVTTTSRVLSCRWQKQQQQLPLKYALQTSSNFFLFPWLYCVLCSRNICIVER